MRLGRDGRVVVSCAFVGVTVSVEKPSHITIVHNKEKQMFVKGQSGNPKGRPKGLLSGRAKAVMELDNMLSVEGNLELLHKKLQEYFEADPIKFMKTLIMPLLPKDINLDITGLLVTEQHDHQHITFEHILEEIPEDKRDAVITAAKQILDKRTTQGSIKS